MVVAGTQGEDPVTSANKIAHLALEMIEVTRTFVSSSGQMVQIRAGLHSGPIVGAVRAWPCVCVAVCVCVVVGGGGLHSRPIVGVVRAGPCVCGGVGGGGVGA